MKHIAPVMRSSTQVDMQKDAMEAVAELKAQQSEVEVPESVNEYDEYDEEDDEDVLINVSKTPQLPSLADPKEYSSPQKEASETRRTKDDFYSEGADSGDDDFYEPVTKPSDLKNLLQLK